MTENGQMRALTESDQARAAEVLAAAFHEDPLIVQMAPEPTQRRALAMTLLGAMARMGILAGRAYGIGNPIQGLAFWRGPGAGVVGPRTVLRAGFHKLLFSRGALGLLRFLGPLVQTQALHRRYAPGPHYYLEMLAVHPDAQGQGLASAVIGPYLARADAEGLPSYLETANPANVALYQHFGFEVMERRSALADRLNIWALLRQPQAVQG